MIQINLLPDEMRRSTRTSPRTLALLFVTTVLCFGAVGTTGFLWFNVRADKQARVDILQEQLENMMPRARYADSLDKEKSEFEKRNKTIREIAASRIVWTRKLDRLSEIVSRDASQTRHKVWLESLQVNASPDAANAGVKFEGFSVGDDIESVSNFHEDLRTDPVFAEGFVAFTPPESKVSEDEEKDVEPAKKMEFKFEAKLPVKDKKKPPVRRAAAPPKAPEKS
jgi:Tfp pilus assembly protein PilN